MNECIDSNAVPMDYPRRFLALRNKMYRFASDTLARGRGVFRSVSTVARTVSAPSVAIQLKHFDD